MGTEPADPGTSDGNSRPGRSRPPAFAARVQPPTESLVAGTMGDRCVTCGAPLAPDQRYCVNCGERRGAPRFALPTASAAASEPSEPAAARPGRGRRPRASSGATLVAGVGTLLLALGVGVLIGHGSGAATKTVQGRAQVIKVNESGGGGSSGGAATTAASTGGGSSQGSNASKSSKGAATKHKSGGTHRHAAHKTKSSAPPTPKPTKQEVQAAQSAANKVTGGSDVNNAPATVTVGGSCTGTGCDPKTHKFTGNFFGN
jgi:hypothetical protein